MGRFRKVLDFRFYFELGRLLVLSIGGLIIAEVNILYLSIGYGNVVSLIEEFNL